MTWQRILVNGQLVRAYVAPRTPLPAFLFDQQRAKCLSCAFCHEQRSAAGGTELQCRYRGRTLASCSAQRLPTGQCGPFASQFKAREGAA